jgi:arsenite methyltransferase
MRKTPDFRAKQERLLEPFSGMSRLWVYMHSKQDAQQTQHQRMEMTFALAQELKPVDAVALVQKAAAMYHSLASGRSGDYNHEMGRALAERPGVAPEESNAIPQTAIASFKEIGYHFDRAQLRSGDHVVVFGSSSRTDSYIAANKVGNEGRVVGVARSDDAFDTAGRSSEEHRYRNVEFRKSCIEDTGLPAETFDVVIGNGAASVAADLQEVFMEAARLLKPGGRLALSDLVTDFRLPDGVSFNATLWAACIDGALQIDQYVKAIEAAGFGVVEIRPDTRSRFASDSVPGADRKYGVKKISVQAVKL